MHGESRGWALLALALVGRISGRMADPRMVEKVEKVSLVELKNRNIQKELERGTIVPGLADCDYCTGYSSVVISRFE